MKQFLILTALAASLTATLPAQAGRMGPHFGNRGSTCNSRRFPGLCRGRRDRGDNPRIIATACATMSTTAPEGQDLEVKVGWSQKFYLSSDAVENRLYLYSEEESAGGEQVYAGVGPAAEDMPREIRVTERIESAGGHTQIHLLWDRYEQWVDCPVRALEP